MDSVFPCTFFNTPEGCKFTAEECKRPHVLKCTHPGCRRAKIDRTHTAANCRNRVEVVKNPLKSRVEESKRLVCDRVIVLVEKILNTKRVTSKSNPTPGKVTGMFFEGLTLAQLVDLLSDEEFLIDCIQDAVNVLDASAALT
jgi:hypothetical protein